MGLYPKNLKEYVALMGVPRGYASKIFIVDTEHGSDSNSGLTFDSPLLTLAAAEDLCTADRHDTVLFVARDTADNPDASITWDKDYVHLIGVGCDLPGRGQRCRVVGAAADALSPVVTVSGNGCMFKNMQFYNGKAAGAASGVMVVSGNRFYAENVFWCTPTATDAASYALKLSGSECYFKRCSIGQHGSLLRTAASRGLWLYKGTNGAGGNSFESCEFLSWSSATTHVLVYTDVDIDGEAWLLTFENCQFHNTISGAGTLAVAIDDNCATADHRILMRGKNNTVAGCTAVADPLTYVLTAEVSGTASGLLMATVNEA